MVTEKASTRTTDRNSTDTNNGGGHQYTLPDEIRLRNYIVKIIEKHFPNGATSKDIQEEMIYLELDNYKGHYIVAGRRKQNALKDLVTEGKLYTKGRTKMYVIVPREDTEIEEKADTEMEENVDTEMEENVDTGIEENTDTGSSNNENNDSDHTSKSAPDLTDITKNEEIDPITTKRVHHIKKLYVKPAPSKVLQRPQVQEAFTALGYLTVGPNVIQKTDIFSLVSACKDIEGEKTSKRGRDRAGDHMSFSIYFRYSFCIYYYYRITIIILHCNS
jgi:hypothetical protein